MDLLKIAVDLAVRTERKRCLRIVAGHTPLLPDNRTDSPYWSGAYDVATSIAAEIEAET